MSDAIVDELLDDGHGRAPNPIYYEDIVRTFRTMPKTYFPGMLIELVREGYRRGGVFKKGGASLLVKMKCEDEA